MSSDVEICNRALSKLGADRIVSIGQDSVEGREVDATYTMVRDAELRAHPWNFSIERAQLAADVTTPSFGPAYRYQLPSDFLRLLPDDPDRNLADSDLQIEGRYITSSETAPLKIRYIKRVTDPAQFDALFVEALACKLAIEMCEKLTQSNTKGAAVRDDYKAAIREARRNNAFENISQRPADSSWLSVRL